MQQTQLVFVATMMVALMGTMSVGLALDWGRGTTMLAAGAVVLAGIVVVVKVQRRRARATGRALLVEPDVVAAVQLVDRGWLAKASLLESNPTAWAPHTALYLLTRATTLATRGRMEEARSTIAAAPALQELCVAITEGWIAAIEERDVEVRVRALKAAKTPGLLRARRWTDREAGAWRASIGVPSALAYIEGLLEEEEPSARPALIWALARGYRIAGDEARGRIYADLLAEDAPWFGVRASDAAIPPLPDLTPPDGWDRPLLLSKPLRPLLVVAAIVLGSLVVLGGFGPFLGAIE